MRRIATHYCAKQSFASPIMCNLRCKVRPFAMLVAKCVANIVTVAMFATDLATCIANCDAIPVITTYYMTRNDTFVQSNTTILYNYINLLYIQIYIYTI